MIKLINGSIFDSKCDLLIIPCDSYGNMTHAVREGLKMNGFPYKVRPMELGDIYFVQNVSSFSNASIIGYAASVDGKTVVSSKDTIRQLAHKVGKYCEENSLTKVNIPLLGTGAGKVPAKDAYLALSDEFSKSEMVTFCVYVLSEDIFNELKTEKPQINTNRIHNPRVFISYTAADLANRNWVKQFVCKLRESGVDARVDIFHLKPGQDLPQWMTNELIMADKVLLICDKYYAEKADSRRGGVGWETMIIQGDMLSHQEQNKYIAILRDENIDQSLPIYIKSRYALNWAEDGKADREFDELLLYLFDCDTEPPIGEIPLHILARLDNASSR